MNWGHRIWDNPHSGEHISLGLLSLEQMVPSSFIPTSCVLCAHGEAVGHGAKKRNQKQIWQP